MSGKGSRPRPLGISKEQFDTNWNLIFGNEQMKQHSRGIITEEISRFFSDNGKKEAVIVKTDKGLVVELYEKSKYIKCIDVTDRSLRYAEDLAENYVMGWGSF